ALHCSGSCLPDLRALCRSGAGGLELSEHLRPNLSRRANPRRDTPWGFASCLERPGAHPSSYLAKMPWRASEVRVGIAVVEVRVGIAFVVGLLRFGRRRVVAVRVARLFVEFFADQIEPAATPVFF